MNRKRLPEFLKNNKVVILSGIAMVVFCYIVTYIGAGKIRKISVTELITE